MTKLWKKQASSMIKRLINDGWTETSDGTYLVYSKGDSIFRINSEVLF